MISERSGVPLHRQVADAIRARITSGEWAPGSYLRAEADLGHDYGVGVTTVRRALAALAVEGLVIRSRGYRTRVMPQYERELVRMPRGSTMLIRMPTPAERVELDLPEGVAVAEVQYGERVTLYPADRYRFGFS